MTKLQKTDQGTYEVIDTRNGLVLRRGIKTASKAAAYVRYYDEELTKAEAQWAAFDKVQRNV